MMKCRRVGTACRPTAPNGFKRPCKPRGSYFYRAIGRECAEHYGFLISPCMPGMPEHKGKVERGIPYVRNSFIAGRDFIDVADANIQLADWLMNKAGLRVHGTTKRRPMEVFNDIEKTALLDLPDSPFSKVTWKEAVLHRDCHVVVNGSFYSAPHRLRGETLPSNRAAEEWPELFGDPLLASAALDRMIHHAHVITITGKSYRARNISIKNESTRQSTVKDGEES